MGFFLPGDIGRGCSVLEIVALVQRVRWTAGPERPGDPSRSVADAGLIARELGWRARWDLTDAVCSAWAAGIPVPVRSPLRRSSLQPAAAG